jgi:Ion channel
VTAAGSRPGAGGLPTPLEEGSREWGIRSRVGRLKATHSFGVVLLLVVALFALAAIAPDSGFATGMLAVLATAVLVVAAWTSGLAGPDSRLIQLALLAGAAAAVAGFAAGSSEASGAVGLVTALMLACTVPVIAVGILDQGEVNKQSVLGAICVYLLLGLFFVFVYGAVAALGSGPFFAQGMDGTRALRLYFSYVTLATLGYGDYTPAGNLGHLLAVIEALAGQLYLVIVLTVLLTRLGKSHRMESGT